MAHTLIMVCAILMILFLCCWALMGQARRRTGPVPRPLAPRKLHDRLQQWALKTPWQGMKRLLGTKGSIRLVCRLAQCRDALPALDVVRRDCRLLIKCLYTLREDLRRAPRLPATPTGEVRMLLLARELAEHSAALDAPSLLDALAAWQKGGALTFHERESLPLCLRVVLCRQLENALQDLHHDLQAHRLGRRLARRAAKARRPMAYLAKYHLPENAAHALLTALREADASSLLIALEEMAEEAGFTAQQLAQLHTSRQSLLAGSISRLLRDLQALEIMDWPRLEESSDPLNHLLAEDPAGVYPRMDFDTRRLYRKRAAALARLFACEEIRLGKVVLALCAQAEPDGLIDHVGWYLMAYPGMAALRRALMTRRGSVYLWLGVRKHTVRRLCTSLVYVLLGCGFLRAGFTLWMLPFFLGIAGPVVHLGVRHVWDMLFPAQPLARMQVDEINDDMRTLLVIPAQMHNHSQVVPLVRRLLLARKACPDGAVDCLLLGDYAAAPTQHSHEDRLIIQTLTETLPCVDGDGGQFMALLRSRAWSRDQRAFIGRDLQRGALESLHRLIVQGECEDMFDFASVPPAHFHRRYAYVLTLPADASLSPDLLLPLLGALTHPLHERRSTPDGMRGTGMLTPRALPDPEKLRTRSSLLAAPPVSCMVGLYRPDALFEDTDGYFLPEALADASPLVRELCSAREDPSAAVLLPLPATLLAGLRQLYHQATTAWQHLPWLLPYVKTAEGVVRNPLHAPGRLRIRQALLRSLLPLCQGLLLWYAAFTHSLFLSVLALFLPEIPSLFRAGQARFSRLAVHALLMPARALVQLDAAFRALWGRLITREHRLDAEPASDLSALENWGQWGYALVLAVLSAQGELFWPGLLIALCMSFFPPLHTWLDMPLPAPHRLSPSMESSLMDTAEATWRFFEETVTQATSYLPPETLQVKPWRGPCGHTGPQAIGLYILACLSACDLDLVDAPGMADRLAHTMDALEQLPLWHGLPFRRYSTEDLAVSGEGVVDAVACGMLCASLLTAAQSLRSCLKELPADLCFLPARMDDFAARMDLRRLYDDHAQLFYTAVNAESGAPVGGHLSLLASPGLVLSFTSLMRREVPLAHFARLSRAAVRAGGGVPLASLHGSAVDYLTSALFLPFFQGTDMASTLRWVLRAQKKHAVEGMFGLSECLFWGFDEHMNYLASAFGAPETALGPGSFHPVIAPYAAALFLLVDPPSACDSLSRLRSRGMLGRLGFFDSIDFDPAHLPDEQHEALVQSHVDVHQGMILCAIAHVLTGGVSRHFASLPQAAAFLPLVKERSAPRLTLPPRALHPEAHIRREAPFRRTGDGLVTPVDAHLLGTGDASLLISSQGTGVLRSRGMNLTPFTGDPTRTEGPQFYLADGTRVFRLGDPGLPGETIFTEGAAQLTRAMGSCHAALTCTVDPLQGAFIHLLEVENLSTKEKTVDLASFLPCDWAKETARPEERVLTLTKPAASPGELPLTMCHALSTHEGLLGLCAETDRTAFLGVDGSLRCPSSLLQPMQEGLIGLPLTPCAAFRVRLRIPGRGKASVMFITRLMGPGEDFSLAALSPRLTDMAQLVTLAQLQSRTVTQSIPLTQEEARTLTRVFGMLLWHSQPHQGAVSPLKAPLSALHALGLPLRLPLLTLALHSPDGSALLRDALRLCAWMAMLGQPIALCCLCEGDQAQAACDHAKNALQAALSGHEALRHTLVLSVPELPDGLRETIEAHSRLILYEGAGTITAQAEALTVRHSVPAVPVVDPKPAPLPAEELLFDCGLGGFQPQTDDYVLRLSPGETTPAPWRCPLGGRRLTTQCMPGGLGGTSAGAFFLTAPDPDDVSPMLGEEVYLRDNHTGALFSPTMKPLGQGMAFRIQFGPGQVQWRASGYGLEMTLTVSAPPESSFSARTLRLKNLSDKKRSFSLALAAHFLMGQSPGDEALCCLTPVDGGVIAHSPQADRYGCICMAEGPCTARCMSTASFRGLHGGAPSALFAQTKDESGSVAVLSMAVEIPARASADVTWIIGACRQMDETEAFLTRIRAEGASSFHRISRQQWAQRLAPMGASTPESSLNILMNRILPWQMHQSPHGLAAACGMALTRPKQLRSALLFLSRQQYLDGSMAPAHAQTPLDLPMAAARYIRLTGDDDILRQQLPWLVRTDSGPYPTQETDTLHTHCLRALARPAEGFMHAMALKAYAQVCDDETRAELLARRERVLEAAMGEQHPDALSCSLAVLALGVTEQTAQALDAAWQTLYDPRYGLLRLREGHNQDTHAAVWMLRALCVLGWHERAWELLQALNPIHHGAEEEYLARYRMPPFVLAEHIHAAQQQKGRAGQAADAHTAALLYTTILEDLLGLEKQGDRLRLHPLVPPEWDDFTLTLQWGASTWHMTCARSIPAPTLDGLPMKDGWITLNDDGKIHQARWPMP